MADPLCAASVSALEGDNDRLYEDLAAGKSRLIVVIDPDAGTLSIFGLQSVDGGFKVRRRDGRHVGSFADLGIAIEAGAVAGNQLP